MLQAESGNGAIEQCGKGLINGLAHDKHGLNKNASEIWRHISTTRKSTFWGNCHDYYCITFAAECICETCLENENVNGELMLLASVCGSLL